MDFGLQITPTDRGIAPDVLAREAEQRGFLSLSVAEHTHIPLTSQAPTPDGVVPDEYKHCHDPFVWLSAVAAVTTRLLIGTGVCLVAQRDLIAVAKQVASLDALSKGRMIFGIGYGWNQAEARSHGIDPAQRRPILREKVLAMQELWTRDVASFDGEHVHLAPSWSWPKPVQSPHPPIVMGAPPREAVFRHIVEFCDGWMPFVFEAETIATLHRMAEEAGRDPSSILLVSHRAPDDPRELARLADLGVHRASFSLPPASPDVVLEKLDHYTDVVATMRGG